MTVGSRPEIGDGSDIYSFDKPEVTTGVGISPVLPADVGTIYDNGLSEMFKVNTWDLSDIDLDTSGTYTAYGTSFGVTGRIEAVVNVKAVASIDPVAITTITGVAPPLPRVATVRYDDGAVGAATVDWDPVSPSKYAYVGTFTVNGKIGPDLTITATVTVKELVSIDDVTLSTVVKEIPIMPATIRAVFSDGSEGVLGVS